MPLDLNWIPCSELKHRTVFVATSCDFCPPVQKSDPVPVDRPKWKDYKLQDMKLTKEQESAFMGNNLDEIMDTLKNLDLIPKDWTYGNSVKEYYDFMGAKYHVPLICTKHKFQQ